MAPSNKKTHLLCALSGSAVKILFWKRIILEGERETMLKIRQRLWFILIFVIVIGFSNSGYPQTRLPDVHFEATPEEVVEAMLQKAGVTQGDVVYDLGCGDGRFVITAAKRFGARGVGVDIDPVRIRESNENARKADVADRVKFIVGDLFETPVGEATVVTLYLLNELNLQLRPKLLRELKPGTRIVSHTFDMGDWEPDYIGQVRYRTFYYWVVPANISGTWQWSHASLMGGWQNELFLNQEFQEVTGKVIFQGWELRIREPRLMGDQLTFRVRYNSEGQNVAMRFNGRVNGDTIKGSVEIQEGPWAGTHEWTAKRIKN
jgi:SAM-dependent methyltransferase